MKKLCLATLLFTIILSSSFSSMAQDFVWAKQIGGSGYEPYATSNKVRLDPNGNVYVFGLFHDAVDFDPGVEVYTLTAEGYEDTFISKFDSTGNLQWVKRFGSAISVYTRLRGAIFSAGYIYTLGSFSGTVDFDPGVGTYNLTASNGPIFISKLDSNGNFVWAKQLGGGGSDIAADALGNIVIVGSFSGAVDLDPGSSVFNLVSVGDLDVSVTKLDSNGNFVWAKHIGGTAKDEATAVAIDEDSSVYTIGSFNGVCDFDPSQNTYYLTELGWIDAFVSKLDSSGNFVWAKQLGGDRVVMNGIVIDSHGNVLTTGSFSGSSDFDPGSQAYLLTTSRRDAAFISKLDSKGNFIWARAFDGTSRYTIATSIATDPSDSVYTTGMFNSTADFDPESGVFNLNAPVDDPAEESAVFISRLNSNGSFSWAGKFAQPPSVSIATAEGYSIAISLAKDIFTTGYFHRMIDFDPGPSEFNLVPSGDNAVFVSRLNLSVNDNDGDGLTPAQGDCNDYNNKVYPGAPELCDMLDNDCDNSIDEIADIADGDGDGWTCKADCREDDASIHPGAVDCLDGIDNDCDGTDGNGRNRVEGYVAFDIDPSHTGDDIRIKTGVATLCEVSTSGGLVNCREQLISSANGSFAFDCVSGGRYRIQTTLNWTDRVIGNNHDPLNPYIESRLVMGTTSDFNLPASGGTTQVQPVLFKPPVVFVHGANSGACLTRPGLTCGPDQTCGLYKETWTTAFDRFMDDDYVTFVADGLAPCEALLEECADGSECLTGTTCNDGSQCERRCSDHSVCTDQSACPGSQPCPRGFVRYLHDYNAAQLAVYLSHVQSILTSMTGGVQVPVDIVAHSMGGLTTRDLIGTSLGKTWAPLIRNVVMLGTPNAGSVNAQLIWAAEMKGRLDAKYLHRRALWYFNQRFGDIEDTHEVDFYYIAGKGGPNSSDKNYTRGSKLEPNPNDGIVGRQSLFDYNISDSGSGFHGNARFRDDENCKAPKGSTRTENCLIRIPAQVYICTPDDHSQLVVTPATLTALQDVLAGKGNTNPNFNCNNPLFGPSVPLTGSDDIARTIRQSTGTLLPLESVDLQHLIDNSTESVFSVEWNTGVFTFTLQDPQGRVIDPAEAASDPSIEYLDGTGSEHGSSLAYIVQNPLSGSWRLSITAGSDVAFAGEFYVARTTSEAAVDLTGASLTDPADVGATVALTATLTETAVPITGATITAVATDRLGGSTLLSCLDNGVAPDASVNDGTYTCAYGPLALSGYHTVEFQAAGTRTDLVPFERSNVFQLSVNSTDATIDGTFNESTPDVNSNLLYDSLTIGVNITVNQAGEYSLEGTLVDSSDVVIDHQIVTGQRLATGSAILNLVFSGVAIREHQVNGPYTLTNLILARSDTDQAVCEDIADAYATASYNWSDFEINDPDSDGVASHQDNCPLVANPGQENSDTDPLGNTCDNCASVTNADQADQDKDGFGDACDLCPAILDAYQHDTDSDGTGDNCDSDADNDGVPNVNDCAMLDATLWSSPSDVTDLSFSGSVTMLWSGQTPADGSTATFDVVKGDLTTLRSSAGNFSAAVCFSAHNSATTATDTFVPSAGQAFYYLVRPRTGCGVGTYGSGTSGERLITSCP